MSRIPYFYPFLLIWWWQYIRWIFPLLNPILSGFYWKILQHSNVKKESKFLFSCQQEKKKTSDDQREKVSSLTVPFVYSCPYTRPGQTFVCVLPKHRKGGPSAKKKGTLRATVCKPTKTTLRCVSDVLILVVPWGLIRSQGTVCSNGETLTVAP